MLYYRSCSASPFGVPQSQHVLQRAEAGPVHHFRRQVVLHVRSLGLRGNRVLPHLQPPGTKNWGGVVWGDQSDTNQRLKSWRFVPQWLSGTCGLGPRGGGGYSNALLYCLVGSVCMIRIKCMKCMSCINHTHTIPARGTRSPTRAGPCARYPYPSEACSPGTNGPPCTCAGPTP